MPASQSIRKRRRKRSDGTVKLNITSMIDMFTLMVVFLLQSFSASGNLITPAQGLMLPRSSVEKDATAGVQVKVSQNSIVVENRVVVDERLFGELAARTPRDDYLIRPLFDELKVHSTAAMQSAQRFNKEFVGKISIQGDVEIPYNILIRVMYSCGQAGYPVMNLVVYKGG